MSIALLPKKVVAWTDEALQQLPRNGHKYELLDGKLIMSPVPANHGVVCVRLVLLLGEFARKHRLGAVFDSSTGFRLGPNLLLSPDVSFVSRPRLKKMLVAPDQFLQGAPDLVVEVLSPSDRTAELHRKLEHYFEHGTRLAWLVNWRNEQVHIHTPDNLEALTGPNDLLTGGAVLPGFRCRLKQIFEPPC